jgi:hypothetical protein
MSKFTDEDMAKIMKPGLRVVRGKDWKNVGKTGTKNKFWLLDFFVLANSLGFK